ncbi:hypothetical protein SAMN05421780_101812 [Flexibacter flexilis DSM 6793]|uniref:Uncharacterized protein n=1 Tax=Flexibacter flexilis DSM 6793 TaxID=927664 RepID=A0A1I1ENY2_9BACT|nr:hypothetical protein [Flexibacter flexilis]SFB86603.1 hypothetical protein SAMN05421780_101812 [Flexibacter flexilis DSM 6793]
MKKVLMLGILGILGNVAVAQPILVTKAAEFLKNKQIDAAKTAIDAASGNPASVNEAKTWYYKGFIYKEVFKQDPVKNKEARLQSVDFFKKSITLDKANEYVGECKANIKFLANTYLQDGTELFNAKKYTDVKAPIRSYVSNIQFADAASFNPEVYSYMAYADEMTGKADSAIFYYEKALEAGYKDALLYDNLANLYHQKKEDKKCLALLKEGAKLYPSDDKIAITEVNVMMANNQLSEIEPILDKAISLNPKNIELYLVQGTALDRIVKANKGIDKEAYFQKRLTAYKKALELDGNNFSANYNMGITYYNRAVDIINDQSYDLDVTMLTKIIDQCSAMFKEAQPFLEKAHKLTPANKNTMLALEGVYYNMNDAHKMKDIQDKLAKIKN